MARPRSGFAGARRSANPSFSVYTQIALSSADRLLHHAHIVVTQGDSFRLSQATNGKGVRPLT